MSRVLDAWVGRTRVAGGERQFEVRQGVWRPAESAVSNLPLLTRIARLLRPRVSFASALTQAWLDHKERGGFQAWEEPLDGIIADGTQVSNTTSETIVCPDFNFPANYMQPGRMVRLTAFGVMSNVVTTPGTFTARVRWGGVGGVALLQSAAQGLDTTAHTNALWWLQAYLICRAQGSSGSMMSFGQLAVFNLLAATAANLLPALLGSAGTPGSSGNAAVSVDTTIAKLLSVSAQFSVSTNPTNATCQGRVIEALN